MTTRLVFQLNVLHQDEEEYCLFALFWEGGKKNLMIGQPYPKKLQKSFQFWRQLYFRYYQFSVPQLADRSGSISFIPSGDPSQDLREAEEVFLATFRRWLEEGEVRRINQQIQEEWLYLTQDKNLCAVDIFLSCSPELERLPWEIWTNWLVPEGIFCNNIHLIRTSTEHSKDNCTEQYPRLRKPRILALLGYDPQLLLLEDWNILQSLSPMAIIEQVKWRSEDREEDIRNKVITAIADDKGWDVLFFAGHSDETATSGGRFVLTSHLSLSINDIEEKLQKARSNGLQLAIFNSCCGLSIANALTNLGLQVVVMREPIHHEVAQRFLQYFCQQLRAFNDVQQALVATCQYLRSSERINAPSAHLIPSFFSPPGAIPFRFQPFGWRHQLRQWLPTRYETIAFGLLLLLGLTIPLQDLLLELRMLVQSFYREQTHQLTALTPSPVLLISIDRESINEAKTKIEGFQVRPMERQYLAQLVKHLSDFNIKTVGIDYELYSQEPRQEKLDRSLRSTVKEKATWLVLAVNTSENQEVSATIASPNWSLRGNNTFTFGDIELPTPRNETCLQSCPFAYLLALSHLVNQSSVRSLQPKLTSQTPFQEQVNHFLDRTKQSNSTFATLKPVYLPMGLRSLIDFSIPYYQAYNRLSASDFLKSKLTPELRQRRQQQVAIIASGGYEEAEDNFSVPLAVTYWCDSQALPNLKTRQECPQVFTGGEIHAYMVHHLLTGHRVTLIPDVWIIPIAALLGKGVTLILLKQESAKRKKNLYLLTVVPMFYAIAVLQLFISNLLLFPWLLPSTLFWSYLAKLYKKL